MSKNILEIAIPTYNRTIQLRKCLKSISIAIKLLSQKDRKFIGITINDNSTKDFNKRRLVINYFQIKFKSLGINYFKYQVTGFNIGSNNNFATLYDAAMLSFTTYTKSGLRFATKLGFISSGLSFVVALVYFIYKVLHWDTFAVGLAPAIIGVFFIGSLQLFFIGVLSEYILSINKRIMNRPLVIEEERINFSK